MRRFRLLLLALLLLIPKEAQAAPKGDVVTAKAYALVEAGSGRLLLGKNEHDRLPMASTTKIMTALLLIEVGEDLDTLVSVPPEAAATGGTSMHLAAGERVSLRDLLYGLMMVSGNDAAVTLAVHLSGSVETFAARMNDKAAALGCADTHFMNPHGLHDPEHYTSAYDLARMARAAMEHPFFRELVSTRRYTTTTGHRPRTFRTKNRVLTEVEGGCGVKTGYTKKAGRCLCFAARRAGMLLIGAVLHASDMWGDAGKLLEEGFAAYELKTFLPANGAAGQVPVTGGVKKSLPAVTKEGILYPIRRDGREEAALDVRLPAAVAAPIARGAPLGKAVLTVDGEQVAIVTLLAGEGVDIPPLGWFLRRIAWEYLAA